MNATFLVTLDLPDVSPGALASTSEVISDAVEDSGLILLSVEPWDRNGVSQDPEPGVFGL